MKKSIIILTFFAVTSCVRVQIPASLQEQMNRIEQGLYTNTKVISQSQTQISELNGNFQTILKGVVKPTSVVTNYDNYSIFQLDSIRTARGLIKKN